MDVRLLFPSLYLGAADLRGKNVTLTISRLAVEDLRTDKGNEKKPIIYFAEMEKRPENQRKRLVVNKTNAKVIAAMYGHETNDWKGKQITVYPTTCLAFGQTVDCIRVREQTPRSQAESAHEETFDSDDYEGEAAQ